MSDQRKPAGVRATLVCRSVSAMGREAFRVGFAGSLADAPALVAVLREHKPDDLPRVGCLYDVVITPAQD